MPRVSQTRIGQRGQLIKEYPVENNVKVLAKRTKSRPTRKRAALGDISNSTSNIGMDKLKVNSETEKPQRRVLTRSAARAAEKNTQENLVSTIKSSVLSKKRGISPEKKPIQQKRDIGVKRRKVVSSSGTTSSSTGLSGTSSNGSGGRRKKDTIDRETNVPKNFDLESYKALVFDIDKEDASEPTHCTNLIVDMEKYWRIHEQKYRVKPTFLGEKGIQKELNSNMRMILIDWLVEVCEEYTIGPQTLFICVNLVDRSLMKFKVTRSTLQLLGCACMLIASKYEEVYGPNIEEFCYISDNTYKPDDMLTMEQRVLKKLDFCITVTTSYTFLTRFMKAGCKTKQQEHLAQYLAELSLLDYQLLAFRSSVVAASIIFLTRIITHETLTWTPTLHFYSRYQSSQLISATKILSKVHEKECRVLRDSPSSIKAITEKFNHSKYSYVSKLRYAEVSEIVPADI